MVDRQPTIKRIVNFRHANSRPEWPAGCNRGRRLASVVMVAMAAVMMVVMAAMMMVEAVMMVVPPAVMMMAAVHLLGETRISFGRLGRQGRGLSGVS